MKKNKIYTCGYFQYSGEFVTDGRLCVLQYGFFRYGSPYDLLVDAKKPFQILAKRLEFEFRPHDISKIKSKEYAPLEDTELVHMKFNDQHRKFISVKTKREYWFDNRYFEPFANAYANLYICEEEHIMKITMSVNGKESDAAFLMGLRKDRLPPVLKIEAV